MAIVTSHEFLAGGSRGEVTGRRTPFSSIATLLPEGSNPTLVFWSPSTMPVTAATPGVSVASISSSIRR
ncbi:MAG: hypothetical protein ACRD8O_24490 [Bryobacteraceae bacterium]